MRIKAECRYCGARVEYFGDLCSDCENVADHNDDFAQITQADLRRLEERMD